jgi:predicted small lipoprotein YifL
MMKSKWLVLAVLILSMLTFTACGKKKEESFEEVDREAVVEEAQKEVEEADAKKDEFLADFTGEMDLTGSWQDEVSQRATMDVEKAETGTYHILIHWASGAKEASTWEISGTYDETSGMLSYENGNYTVHTWDENDKETISDEEVTKGTLMKEGDKLRWSDSKNEEDGLFVKVSE